MTSRDRIIRAALNGINEMLRNPDNRPVFGLDAKVQLFEREGRPPCIRVVDYRANVYELELTEY